jgi:Subtilase family
MHAPPPRRLLVALSLTGLLLGSCADHTHLTVAAGSPQADDAVAVAESVRVALERDGRARALILLDPAYQAVDGGLDVTGGSAMAAGDGGAPSGPSDVEAVQRALLGALPEGGLDAVHSYVHFPVLYAEIVGASALTALRAHPAVLAIEDDRAFHTQLTQSLALIDQPAAARAGYTGLGTAVAVLDTGADYTRLAFGNCAAPGAGGCRIAAAQDFAPDDGVPDDNGHGTNVAGIVAGVAPGARILALDVFTGPSAYSNVILRAVDWVITNRARYGVVALNLSLGSGLYEGECPNDVFASGLAAARGAGILPVVASGNSGAIDRVSSPACVPSALAVGAVYDGNVGAPSFPAAGCSESSTRADQITCFSNASPKLALLAPGSSIAAAGWAMSGTSQAAPHVAGAAAVLAAALPNAGPNGIAARLTGTGPMLTDPRNGLARHRLDLAAALGSAVDDVTGPTGTVTLAGGAAATRASTVALRVDAEDPSGVASMCVSSAPACAEFVPFARESSFALPRGDGPKTVYVTLKDAAGNRSAQLTASVMLDTTRPRDGELSVLPGDGQLSVAMTGAADSAAGTLSYVVAAANGDAPPASCDAGTIAYEGTSPSAVLDGLANGVTLSLRVCARDAAGNLSPGVTVTTRARPELTPPSGSVSIASGASYTATRDVRLTVRASDPAGIGAMCVSATPSCTSWLPFASTVPLRLVAANGTVTAYVSLRDGWGNATPSPLTDTIVLDTVTPSVSALSASQSGSGRLAVRWAGSDATSGLGSFTLQYARGSRPPASCRAGTRVYEGEASAFRHADLAPGSHAYRLCATDRAGNTSIGRTYVATVR